MSACPPTFAERMVSLEVRTKHLETGAADVELRLRRIERTIQLGIGALAVLNVALKFWF